MNSTKNVSTILEISSRTDPFSLVINYDSLVFFTQINIIVRRSNESVAKIKLSKLLNISFFKFLFKIFSFTNPIFFCFSFTKIESIFFYMVYYILFGPLE